MATVSEPLLATEVSTLATQTDATSEDLAGSAATADAKDLSSETARELIFSHPSHSSAESTSAELSEAAVEQAVTDAPPQYLAHVQPRRQRRRRRGVGLGMTWLQTTMAGRMLLRQVRVRTPEQLSGLRTVQNRRLFAKLHRFVIAAIVFGLFSLVTAVWLLIRGSSALMASRSAHCQGPLREWLRMYLFLQLGGPLSVPVALLLGRFSPFFGRITLHMFWPVAAVLVLGWSAGAVADAQPPAQCPALRGLAAEALALQIVHIVFFVIAGMYILASRPIIKRLNDAVARNSLVEEAASQAAEIPFADIPDSEECVICLGCLEDTPSGSDADLEGDRLTDGIDVTGLALDDGSPRTTVRPNKERPRWRQVSCGHKFHEQCLFEWMRRARVSAARRCPVCRCRLNQVSSRRRNVRNFISHGEENSAVIAQDVYPNDVVPL